jgi:PAS domain-containing protein
LKRHFPDAAEIPAAWEPFLQAVDDAYRLFDNDRNMMERSLELSSNELLEANSELRAVFQSLPDLLFRLDEHGVILDFKGGGKNRFFNLPKGCSEKSMLDGPVC